MVTNIVTGGDPEPTSDPEIVIDPNATVEETVEEIVATVVEETVEVDPESTPDSDNTHEISDVVIDKIKEEA